MSEVNYKMVNLSDIFNLNITSNGSILTKSFVREHMGDIPVYGTTKNEFDVSYGYIKDNIEGIKYFNDCLTINRNGSAGYLFVRTGKFSINSDVTPLVLYKQYQNQIDLNYLKYVLEPITINKFNHNRKAGKAGLEKINIPIPITEDGEFDIVKQIELAEKYNQIHEQKQIIMEKVQMLKNISVVMEKDNNSLWRNCQIIELFYPKGGKMEYSKTWAKDNSGEFPLYSGTTVGEYARVNVADYDGEYLTWCIDGLAGYIMYHNEAFSLTCHRGVLLPTEKCINIDLKYMKYVLEPIFRKNKKGREGDLGKNEYTSLKPIAIKRMKDTVPIPINADGSYDLERQRKLAEKYEQIEVIKKELFQKIVKLLGAVVS